MNGKTVFQDKKEASQSSILNFNLDNGAYVLKVSNEKNVASSKFMIDL